MRLKNHPLAYNNIDGVGELGIGFMCLAYSLLMWLQVHTPCEAIWHQMYTLFIYVGVMCAIIHYGSKAIKQHITYPRTGFVEYRAVDRVWRPLMLGAVVAPVISAGAVLAARRHLDVTALPAWFGLFLAAVYAHGIARTVGWKWIVAGLMALGSLVIGLLPPEVVNAAERTPGRTMTELMGGIMLTMTLYGTLLLISGAVSFWLYLRHTQPPVEDPQ